jgi:hypothetical protein
MREWQLPGVRICRIEKDIDNGLSKRQRKEMNKCHLGKNIRDSLTDDSMKPRWIEPLVDKDF